MIEAVLKEHNAVGIENAPFPSILEQINTPDFLSSSTAFVISRIVLPVKMQSSVIVRAFSMPTALCSFKTASIIFHHAPFCPMPYQ